MIKNYFKIAWRNLIRHKLFSFLNIFGLAVSMSAGMIILLLYEDGHNYDKFHTEADRIYRLNTIATRNDGSVEPYATSPLPLRALAENSFDWIEKVTSLSILNETIIKENQRFNFHGKVTDGNFLRIFNFSLLSGDKNSALDEPNSIVLTSELSEKLFKNSSPINQMIEIGNRGIYKITGVLNPNPSKTHFEFEALLSANSSDKAVGEWQNYQNTYTYIKTKPHVNINQAIADINQKAKPYYKNLVINVRDASYSFDLQALPEITPGYSIANAMGKGLPEHLLWFLSLMGFVVMASAIFNYSNLTLAKSLNRAKEIGVRKVIGANRKQILVQIISEGILISFVAFLFAIVLTMFFKTQLMNLQSFNFFDFNLNITPFSIAYFLIFTLIVGLVAGLLPAITISKLNPLLAFKNIENLKIFKSVGWTKSLLVLQIVFTMLFLMVVTTLQKQVEYAIKMDYGFSTNQIYNIQLQGIPAHIAKAEFSKIAGVETISAIDKPIGTYSDAVIDIKVNQNDNYKQVSSYSVDENMMANLGLNLKTGNNFKSSLNATNQVIVNEDFIEKFKLGDATTAIGKSIFMNDTTTSIISGVVKDFLFKPADEALEPLILQNIPSKWKILNIKITPNRAEQTIADIKATWNKIANGYEFKGEFYETTIENNYSIYKDVNKFIQFFAFLGTMIGIMGLLGMTIYSVNKRLKEVSIRKVLGASETDLVLTLSKSYIIIVGIGFMIAIPLGLFMCGQILNNFANRINLGLNIVLPGFILLTLLAIITVCSQTIKAAVANPVKSLRTE